MINIPDDIRKKVYEWTGSNGIISGMKMKKRMTDDIIAFIKDNNISPVQLYYLVIMKLTDIPRCPMCDKEIATFWKHRYCSKECGIKSPATQEQKKQTNIQRYGTMIPVHYNPDSKAKSKQTCLEKYGAETYFGSTIGKQKVERIIKEKYGVDSALESPEIRKKIQDNIKEKYGVDNISQTQEWREKYRNSNIERYGYENPSQSPVIKNKVKETNIRRYGVSYTFDVDEYYEKRRKTCLERYHADSYFGSVQGRNRIKDAIKEKYGVDNISQCANNKIKVTKAHRSKNIDKLMNDISMHDIDIIDKDAYINGDNEIDFRCLQCNHIFTHDFSRTYYIRCPYCTTSLGENEIVNYVDGLLPYTDIVRHDRTMLDGLELDIYIPSMKIAYEYDGTYWHSTIKKDKAYHLMKTKMCEKKGIRLLHIREDEWKNKQAIVKSMICKSLNMLPVLDIMKCDIKSIDEDEYGRFIKENSILNYAYDKNNKYGMYADDKLMAVCNISYDKIVQYCPIADYHIVSWVNVLLNAFGNDISIMIDRYHFTGNDCLKSGFDIAVCTEPNEHIIAKRLSVFDCGLMLYRKK